ncbi:translation initiation factor IF-2 N-terminal domain-containing protein [Thermococcus sp.]|uniref:translation initiation factor IF-2 N-terminal domain-containing protein n=1 Tax=Thermococcus sp. TaxID=35749 RepID=UPI00260122DD|nr:translation initiation factor IF-2 N-terminal domain-containing protein [Thermococcus sp.]
MRASVLLRGVVDLLLLIVFVGMAVTGIGLYLAPSGRIADSIGWTFFGMDKDTLTNVHTYLGFIMIGLVGVHLAVGFRSMLVMLKSAFKSSKAKVMAGLIIPILLIAVGFQAFSAYTGEEETTYESYDSYYEEESTNSTAYITGTMMKYYTVQELAKEFNVSTDALIEKLKEKGIEATPDEKLVEIEYKYDLDREEFKAMLEEIIAELRGENG